MYTACVNIKLVEFTVLWILFKKREKEGKGEDEEREETSFQSFLQFVFLFCFLFYTCFLSFIFPWLETWMTSGLLVGEWFVSVGVCEDCLISDNGYLLEKHIMSFILWY